MMSMTAAQEAKKGKKYKGIDWTIFYLVLILVGIGITMVFSASYVQAGILFGDSLMFLKKNLLFSFLGFFVMYLVSKIDYRLYKKWAGTFMVINLLLLIVTLMMDPIRNSRRWIRIAGLTFQTSEFTKYACIIMTAKILSNSKKRIKDFETIIKPLSYVGASILLIMQQRDLSTSLSIVFVCFVMLYIGRARFSYLLSLGVASVGGLMFYLLKLKDSASNYQVGRIKAFLDPFKNYIDGGMQVVQSMYALSSGGIWGLGLGRSKQKFFYLPVPQNDFVFAIIGEELGYIGTIVVLLLFTALIAKCMAIVLRAPDTFAALLVAGIALQIGVQVMINVGVITGSIPNTGIVLPFISYGGTSLVITMASMGIVLNVSRHCTK